MAQNQGGSLCPVSEDAPAKNRPSGAVLGVFCSSLGVCIYLLCLNLSVVCGQRALRGLEVALAMFISMVEGEEGADRCGEAEPVPLTPCFCHCLAWTIPASSGLGQGVGRLQSCCVHWCDPSPLPGSQPGVSGEQWPKASHLVAPGPSWERSSVLLRGSLLWLARPPRSQV